VSFRVSLDTSFTRARSRSSSACPLKPWRSYGPRDSDALIEPLASLGDLGAAILATGSVSGELLGDPSAEIRANLADSPVRLFAPYLSM
jgi:hypothetical protein